MEGLTVFFQMLLYLLGATLLVVLIVLAIKLIYTVDKTNEILDNVDSKVKSLDGLFEVIDSTSNAIASLKDRLFDKFFGIIGKVGRKNRKKEEEEFYE